jgi:hypothetical protein
MEIEFDAVGFSNSIPASHSNFGQCKIHYIVVQDGNLLGVSGISSPFVRYRWNIARAQEEKIKRVP